MIIDAKNQRGTGTSPCAGIPPNAIPEAPDTITTENSQTGVSTNYALVGSLSSHTNSDTPHWYTLRTTYGREKKAYDYMVEQGVTAFLPTITRLKAENGKRVPVVESRLTNMFFAYGTEKLLQTFVYDNANLPYLRFYYRHFYEGRDLCKTPLIVPDNQINSLKIICEAEAKDVLLTATRIPKFEIGQSVRVIEGPFSGVEGVIARFKGQQRVGVVINGLLTAITAYIPSAFVEIIE